MFAPTIAAEHASAKAVQIDPAILNRLWIGYFAAAVATDLWFALRFQRGFGVVVESHLRGQLYSHLNASRIVLNAAILTAYLVMICDVGESRRGRRR